MRQKWRTRIALTYTPYRFSCPYPLPFVYSDMRKVSILGPHPQGWMMDKHNLTPDAMGIRMGYYAISHSYHGIPKVFVSASARQVEIHPWMLGGR